MLAVDAKAMLGITYTCMPLAMCIDTNNRDSLPSPKIQTSKVFETQFAGIPAEDAAESPFTLRVVVPPLLSTLHVRPAL